jgi:hypothetical protein
MHFPAHYCRLFPCTGLGQIHKREKARGSNPRSPLPQRAYHVRRAISEMILC